MRNAKYVAYSVVESDGDDALEPSSTTTTKFNRTSNCAAMQKRGVNGDKAILCFGFDKLILTGFLRRTFVVPFSQFANFLAAEPGTYPNFRSPVRRCTDRPRE